MQKAQQSLSRITTADGVNIAYSDLGQGEPVLLVHGFPDTMQVWRNQMDDLLAAGYRVIRLDTRGCGQSDAPSVVKSYDLALLVSDLCALLDHLSLDKVKLVGHDWGAAIGWAFCLAHPERVERYVAVSVGHPAAYAGAGWRQMLKSWYAGFFQLRGVAEWMVKSFDWWMLRTFSGNSAEFDTWRAELSRPGRLSAGMNYYRANALTMLFGKWGKVNVPVHGIWSRGDLFLTEAQMTGSAKHVNGPWSYTALPGNHWVQLDEPALFNTELLRALGQP